MALEEILKSMEEQAKEERERILRDAKAEAARIKEEGKKRADEAYRAEFERRTAPLKAECTRIVNEARIELQRSLQGRKEELWQQAVSEARKVLSGLRKSKEYSEIFEELLHEALEGMNHDVVLEVASGDKSVAEAAAAALHRSAAAVHETLDALGGVVVYAPKTRVRAVNTLDSRLERVASLHASELAAELFGSAAPPGSDKSSAPAGSSSGKEG